MIGEVSLVWRANRLIADSVSWASPQWLVPVAVVAALLSGLTIWNYGQSNAMGNVRWVAAALKIAAIGLAAICLLQPMRNSERAQPRANLLPILIDRSESMEVQSTGGSTTRRERIEQLFGTRNDWLRRLEQDFDVRGYAFSSRVAKVSFNAERDFHLDTTNEYSSRIRPSVEAVRNRFLERPIAGIVLFTDGNATQSAGMGDWKDLNCPVYPVVPNESASLADVRVTNVTVRQTDFESAPVSVRVQVENSGDERDLVVRLEDYEHEESAQEQSLTLRSGQQTGEVTFQFRPDQSGLRFFRATVFAQSDRDAFDSMDDGQPRSLRSDVTLVNNRRLITVDRDSGPYRILYVAGRPNWEFKFLRRAIASDAEIELVGLLRIANKEPKFSFRDQGVSGSNSLFRGVDEKEAELAQQYDEPVIIRMGVKESDELSDGFPESAEELFAYHAVILDDIESAFFSEDQLLLLRRFVALRGGGLLMLGGQESFSGKEFSDGVLGELSAVYGPREGQQSVAAKYQYSISREGMLEPWLRLRRNESDERSRLNRLPHLTTVNAIGDAKPGAVVLADVESEDGVSTPALVTQRFGRGRTAASPIGDLWRWSMHRTPDSGDETKDDPAQMWRQLAHWLVGEVPRRVELRVEDHADSPKAVDIVVSVSDEAYLPLDNADVELTITPIGSEPLVLQASADEQKAGVYRVTYWCDRPGAYRVSVKASGADHAPIGEDESGWTYEPAVNEFRNVALNREVLTAIAEQTGGKVISDGDLAAFAEALPSQKVPVMQTWTYPLWHSAWWLTAIIACLCTEWGLRRWKGMA